jgi:hypothetical protein
MHTQRDCEANNCSDNLRMENHNRSSTNDEHNENIMFGFKVNDLFFSVCPDTKYAIYNRKNIFVDTRFTISAQRFD